MVGAAPTGLNRTTTFSCGKPPAAARAAVASRGSVIRTVDALIVRGRSGEALPSRTGDAGGESRGGEAVAALNEGGDAMLGCLVNRRLLASLGSLDWETHECPDWIEYLGCNVAEEKANPFSCYLCVCVAISNGSSFVKRVVFADPKAAPRLIDGYREGASKGSSASRSIGGKSPPETIIATIRSRVRVKLSGPFRRQGFTTN